ncbi:MAG: MarC family protein, partial [Dehalococcoidia bacterium]
EEEQEGIARQNVALVPLGIPLLAGPGAITAVLVWQQSSETPLSSPLLASAVILACLITFIIFYLGERIYRLIGVGGIRVVTRIMGLLLAVIAVQFIVDGIQRI